MPSLCPRRLITSSCAIVYSLRLSSEGAALRQTGQTACRLADHLVAIAAQDDSLGVAEDGGDLQAARALHIHEEAVGGL
eukprot:CAMPEP_0206449436 /NCGR_PEP_ID=MMETSP0324_2-20121206/18087_1 /ASSEMBLY_ACC=CAM_ASM_000836 /TAXON_ID=2866 /ORGANISM="Crypthecodinium cohnii, Strain Seligo" /LENGTH=78 /DNA_ID=CAMNT_0053918811 /DNA_START=57 /DNA_END=290 /DNA_ORIENTATION=+